MNELQPLWRPESARAAPEPCAREAAEGGGLPCPSHPPLFLSLPPAGPRARLGPVPLPPSRSLPPPLRPTPYLGLSELPWVRVGASSRGKDHPCASAGRRGAGTPLTARRRRAWGAQCEPAPGEDAGAAETGRGGGRERWIGRTRGRKGGRVGKRGKSEAGRRRRRKVGIDASVFCCRCCPRAGSRAGGKAVER